MVLRLLGIMLFCLVVYIPFICARLIRCPYCLEVWGTSLSSCWLETSIAERSSTQFQSLLLVHVQISEAKFSALGALGAGLLTGTALAVILPEGFHAFQAAQHATGQRCSPVEHLHYRLAFRPPIQGPRCCHPLLSVSLPSASVRPDGSPLRQLDHCPYPFQCFTVRPSAFPLR